MLDLCCFGFVSHVQILTVEHYPKANSGTLVSDVFASITPDAPIMALVASHLGLDVGLVSNNVGSDTPGRFITDLLSNFGINTTVVNVGDHPTPQTVVICDLQDNRTWFSFLPKVQENLLLTDFEMFKSSKLVYIDMYTVIRKASIRAIRYASEHRIPLFVNLGGEPLSREMTHLLREANVAIIQTSWDDFSDERANDYAKDYAKVIQESIQPEFTIVTLAKKGAICATPLDLLHVPAYSFQTIHSNGAGAAFSAGFAYAYLCQWDLEKSMRFASALGGLFCTVTNGFSKFSTNYVLNIIQEQARD